MKAVRVWFYIFILLAVLYLAAILFNATSLQFYLKPALLLPLISAASISRDFQNKYLLLAALAFSCTGDILLLFVFRDPVYFILGLCSFLLAHIAYIILFIKELRKAKATFEIRKNALVVITIYLATLLLILIPHLAGLTIPVLVYAIVISIMFYMAWLLSAYWPKPASVLLFTGALSFILSDSLLAVDKFYHPLPLAGFLIMLTYLYAQYSLVKGCLTGAPVLHAAT